MFDYTDQLAVNTIRTLSIDAIQKANSGHPGLPMGAAPMAYVLWSKFLKVNPKTSRKWSDRDRFVLSAGHGSAMLYSLLHLAGYQLTIDDLKSFRQWASKTPGHPEIDHTDGVEATTGPLGQGIANAVGMAMAEAHLAAQFNRPGFDIVDHYTYAINGDGDLMEGVSQEACSLAGKLKLGKLILLYDSNNISLDGKLEQSFVDNVQLRFESYGWQHIFVADGNNLDEIATAIERAKAELSKPTIIEIKTTIGYGAQNEGTNKVHGAPLGAEGVKFAKASYGWDYPEFFVPEEVAKRFRETLQARGESMEQVWTRTFTSYAEKYPELAEQYQSAFANKNPEFMLTKHELGEAKASRVTSQEAIQELSAQLPNFWGGSADLSSSNNTMAKADSDFMPDNRIGRNIWFGVREHAMGAVMNGIAQHGGTRVYGGTFFVFSQYMLPAVRMAALQHLPVTFVWTHDSVAVGEDGPTHEPVEQLAAVRAMPELDVIRPADGNEVVAAWRLAVTSENRPTALVLTRQNLPVLPATAELAEEGVARGAYILSPEKGTLTGILIATGSEVALALEAQKQLGEGVRVVSMPAMNRFDAQDSAYREKVLPLRIRRRLAVEAGTSFGWGKYVGLDGATVTIDKWGASAPASKVLAEYGFSVENVVAQYKKLN